MRPLLAVALAAALSGCGLLYTDVRVPRAWRSATPADVKARPQDEQASGRACNRSLLFLFAWGDGGYAAAARDALRGRQDALLYDVQADVQATSVLLGLYTRVCTVVQGRVGKP